MTARPLCYEHRLPAHTWDVDLPGEHAPARDQRVNLARTVCNACPLRTPCLANAVKHHESGVWGGEYLHDGVIVPVKTRLRVVRRAKRGRPRKPIVHGTPNGYRMEHRRGLPTCPSCREAASRDKQARNAAARERAS